MLRPSGELESIIGYTFKDRALLTAALTHASAGGDQNYERLEFLGDRVLALVIAEILFQKFEHEAEGDLAKRLAALVQGETLAKLSSRISLADFIVLSPSERESGGAQNDHILADVFESLIGAMYIDGGFAPCRTLIAAHWQDIFTDMKAPPQHPKTQVQEWLQQEGLPLPIYDITGQAGPDHAPIFTVRMSVKGYAPISAQGRSRAEAEKSAAKEFLTLIGVM